VRSPCESRCAKCAQRTPQFSMLRHDSKYIMMTHCITMYTRVKRPTPSTLRPPFQSHNQDGGSSTIFSQPVRMGLIRLLSWLKNGVTPPIFIQVRGGVIFESPPRLQTARKPPMFQRLEPPLSPLGPLLGSQTARRPPMFQRLEPPLGSWTSPGPPNGSAATDVSAF